MFSLQSARFAGALIATVWVLQSTTVRAGPGHDHGADPAAIAGTASPRAVAVSENYEFVGTLKSGQLTIYLDRMRDTSPVADARIELTVVGEMGVAQPQPDGTFVFDSPILVKPGEH